MPKIILLIFLGILFYIGIWVNFYLLDKKIPVYINIMLVILVILLLIMDFILSYIKYSTYEYRFYNNIIEIDLNRKDTRTVEYKNIKNVNYEKNLWDKILNTGSLTINLKNNKKQKISFIDHSKNYYMYLKKIIELNKTERI